MATWIERMNEKLNELGLYPDLEAFPISDAADHLLLLDTQEATVYKSHEGVDRLLSLVDAEGDDRETFEAVFHALRPNVVEDMRVYEPMSGIFAVDHFLAE